MKMIAADLLRVRVLHSEPLIAAGVHHSLAQEVGVVVDAGATQRWEDADVVVADLPTGLRLAAEIRSRPAARAMPRLLILAAHDREAEVRRALESGVHGYLLANCATHELVEGIRTVGTGARYLSVAVAQRVADSMCRDRLTAREFAVLQLVAKGQCNKSIAKTLEISIGTVKAHVKAILSKLDATSRTHAASVAVDRGLVG